MDPDEWWSQRAAEARSDYWRLFRAQRRQMVVLRVIIIVGAAWGAVFGVLSFLLALQAAEPWRIATQLFCAAVDFTCVVINLLRWPRWPKPDPRIPLP